MIPHDPPTAAQFWANYEEILNGLFVCWGIDEHDAAYIATDITRRCGHIRFTEPPDSKFFRCFAILASEMVEAERRLFTARHGRMPSRLMGEAPHEIAEPQGPFLVEMRRVCGLIEVEANAAEAERGRRVN